jgi:FKBP-type peptidyl-prolyl cis-trans isomerase SlpA
MTLAPGVVVSFRDAAGAELPGVIKTVEGDWVTVDFNHPLAGRDLTFEVEILQVERWAPEQPLQIR